MPRRAVVPHCALMRVKGTDQERAGWRHNPELAGHALHATTMTQSITER
jgi:hypothetical protein